MIINKKFLLKSIMYKNILELLLIWIMTSTNFIHFMGECRIKKGDKGLDTVA